MYTVGIDIGSVSINCVVVDDSKRIVYEHPYVRHFGRFLEQTRTILQQVYQRYHPRHLTAVAFTGTHARIIASRLGAPYEFESITEVLGARHLVPDAATIISMGGQDAALYQIAEGGNGWYLKAFAMNGPCAAGTGSFIDQQAERLSSFLYSEAKEVSQEHINRILADFISLGEKSQNPAPVACRCTVFTKSDMIHLQNKGEPLANIIAGLHTGNAANYISTIIANHKVEPPVVFIGGVASNRLQVKAFRHYFPDLLVPPHHTAVAALGVALWAQDNRIEYKLDLDVLTTLLQQEQEGDFPRAPALVLEKSTFVPDQPIARRSRPKASRLPVFLGMDIGSTTTKTVLMDQDCNIVHKQYVQTQGKPIEVAQRLLASIYGEFGDHLELLGTATTGSGRHVVGDFIAADLILDEITAHARAAVHWDPRVDTVFEIGGQDSKYIWIENTNPLDFDMNKVCAAGTGSFLHELANKLGINIVGEFQEIALAARRPINLAERCTVFMESDLVSYAQKGARLEDLIAGLCYAIVHNYLNRVVQKRKIGQRIMFLGGPSLNKGIVAAFERVLGQEIITPAHREVLGAHGAALAVMEKQAARGRIASRFPGFPALIGANISFREKICRADRNCHNECKLKIYDFGGRKSIWGGDCGRYEVRQGQGEQEQNWFKLREKTFTAHLPAGVVDQRQLEKSNPVDQIDGKPAIALPLALHFYQYAVLWSHFWANLGYRVILSAPTDQATVMAGVEAMTTETCFPIKVFHGHVKSLTGLGRFLFLPVMTNMVTPRPEETGFFCPLVQGSRYMVTMALGLDREAILAPTVSLKDPPAQIAADLHHSIGARLGLGRRRLEFAFRQAWEAQVAFERELIRQGRQFLRSLDPQQPWVVVSGRPYNLYDERANLRLGHNLAKLGIKAIPHDFLDTGDIDLSDFPEMYWGLGSRILRTAKFVKQTPGAYAIHLSNFSCGPDSFIEHFYLHVLAGKPSLVLELDEHSAVAGVVTRLEAYRNVIHNEHRLTQQRWSARQQCAS